MDIPVERVMYRGILIRNQKNTEIDSKNVSKLKLRWSFGIKNIQVRAQPAVIGKIILLTGSDTLYAANKEEGCVYWSFKSINW